MWKPANTAYCGAPTNAVRGAREDLLSALAGRCEFDEAGSARCRCNDEALRPQPENRERIKEILLAFHASSSLIKRSNLPGRPSCRPARGQSICVGVVRPLLACYCMQCSSFYAETKDDVVCCSAPQNPWPKDWTLTCCHTCTATGQKPTGVLEQQQANSSFPL